MPCVSAPKPPIPSLPGGIKLEVPIPSVPNASVPNVCCTLPGLPSISIPTPLPPLLVNPAFVATLRAALSAAHDFFDQLPLTCPRG